jgi:hypothetical protein
VNIPKDPALRERFYADLMRDCLSSRVERYSLYSQLRNYYLYGSASQDGAPYNKIGSTIDTMCSFLYSPDSVRFSMHLGATTDPEDVYKAIPLAAEVTDQWRMSGTHLRFMMALRWSMVFGSMILKVQWFRGQARTFIVEPHQFGVLREDTIELADQEAFCNCYTITRTQLESMLEGNPRKASIMARVGVATADGNTGRLYSEGLSRLILGGPVAGVTGSLATGNGGGFVDGGMGGRGTISYDYSPKVDVDLIDMVDLYVWNDEKQDYQLVTLASPNVVIYDRPQSLVGVPGVPHYVVVRPEHNLYDYFWGESYVARLAWLQDWRSERLMQIRSLMGKQYDPPISAIGMTGIADEKIAAFRSAGGFLNSSSPTGKIEVHKPDMPGDAFAELSQIDTMFDDLAGIGHVLQGKGEAGVRSRGQADLMARLGSSRPKARAVVAEESAEDVATLILRNVQEHSHQRFQANIPGKAEPLTFIAEQFTKDYEVKVDAHSSSPIFVEDRKHDATTLFEAHAIDRATLLDMYDPPNVQALKANLKVIEAQEAKQREAQMAAEAQGKHPPKGK